MNTHIPLPRHHTRCITMVEGNPSFALHPVAPALTV